MDAPRSHEVACTASVCAEGSRAMLGGPSCKTTAPCSTSTGAGLTRATGTSRREARRIARWAVSRSPALAYAAHGAGGAAAIEELAACGELAAAAAARAQSSAGGASGTQMNMPVVGIEAVSRRRRAWRSSRRPKIGRSCSRLRRCSAAGVSRLRAFRHAAAEAA
jgi:hypothetical protein